MSLACQTEKFAALNGLLPRTSSVLQQMAQGKSDSNADSNDQNGKVNSEGQSERGADAAAAEAGGGAPNDDLHGVDPGDGTYLNTREWKYASFFNRVKRAVAEEWHPDIVYLRHDPSGNVYGTRDRVTVLRIHLKPDGALSSVALVTLQVTVTLLPDCRPLAGVIAKLAT